MEQHNCKGYIAMNGEGKYLVISKRETPVGWKPSYNIARELDNATLIYPTEMKTHKEYIISHNFITFPATELIKRTVVINIEQYREDEVS